jgi:hypothetical protein
MAYNRPWMEIEDPAKSGGGKEDIHNTRY